MTHPKEIISVDKVSFRRGKKRILKNINWKVHEGEHYVVFGPNASGKTTLLKLVTGYLWPTKGKISVFGKAFGTVNLSELRKKIGWISTSLEWLIYDEDPALEIVLSGKSASTRLWKKATSKDSRKAERLLKMLKCGDIPERPYGVLSQGERKKVLIARSLMSEPELLILDEPCEGLDLLSREKFLEDISALSRLKKSPTIIFVTHHVEEILNIFNKILLLKEGSVFSDGPIEQVLNSKNISRLFGLKLEIKKKKGRHFSTYF